MYCQLGPSHRLPPQGLHGPATRILLAGCDDEPVEAQVYVAAGRGLALAYELNVVVDPGRDRQGSHHARRTRAIALPGGMDHLHTDAGFPRERDTGFSPGLP